MLSTSRSCKYQKSENLPQTFIAMADVCNRMLFFVTTTIIILIVCLTHHHGGWLGSYNNDNTVSAMQISPSTGELSAVDSHSASAFRAIALRRMAKLAADIRRNAAQHPFWPVQKAAICDGCKFLIDFARWGYRRGIPVAFMADIADEACYRFKMESEAVCSGLIDEFRAQLVDVLSGSRDSARDICGLFLSVCAIDDKSPAADWNVMVSAERSGSVLSAARRKSDDDISASTNNKALPLRVLHLTDIHVDLLYQPGSPALCADVLCCRAVSSSSSSSEMPKAGYWGYNQGYCDTPPQLFDAMLEHVARHDNVSFILWTGDAVPHDIWNQSRAYQLNVTAYVNAAIQRHFPTTPVFATLGNHESYPVNQFLQPGAVDAAGSNQSWLYTPTAAQWVGWGPDASQQKNILKGGYYSYRPPSLAGLKIVSLNTNYCAKLNWWLLLDDDDAGGQLAWLESELRDSETRRNESVYIIGHTPPTGCSCIKPWRDNYFRIVSRFSHIIRGTFYGHTHKDEFSVTYNPVNLSLPTSVAYITPSLITYAKLNPGYRVFVVDGGDSYTILDHETYIVNLTAANAQAARRTGGVGKPADLLWQLEYTARILYGLADMSPQSWGNLSARLASTPALFQLYYNNYYKQQESWTQQQQLCDAACKAALLCDTRSNACPTSGDGLGY